MRMKVVSVAEPTGAMIKEREVTYSDFRGFGTVLTTVGVGTESSASRTQLLPRHRQDSHAEPEPGIEVVDRNRFQGQVFSNCPT